ncbi:AraC family transcriptional regulator [Dyella sp. LX-66]|uniref:AraC family transcriptional regulator n=1 Tax=unclassified Dyella TaxID=2634549 RepID=UPI001BE11CBC|nr:MULTISPECIES: AraC family transcriptional regulator [unclassified Dyella]MBT2117478.1 AraC family transcriptional regulator [Dyella sp. LX-1]MBT2138542.1 AraC family transcriptional regulator [Dyella sp. LX-66]
MARPATLAGLAPSAAHPLLADDPRYTAAEFPPNKLLYLAQMADALGVDSRPWFAGLALSRTQIADPALRVSYRQASLFARRALQALDVPDAGLRIGREGTIGGFGLLGLAMMTSHTLGDAMLAGIAHHKICGCLLELNLEPLSEREVALVAWPRFGDTELLPFFCEELFASCLMIARELVGPELRPVRVEFGYPRPAYARAYEELFECEVRFGTPQCRLLIGTPWLARTLPGHNPLTAKQALALCAQQMTPDGGEPHQEIVAAVERLLRSRLRQQPRLLDVARTLNLSERSLRRKLAESGRIFREIHDRVRAERALELLRAGQLSVAEIGSEIGFSDPREFRRAFKRWTGMPPQNARHAGD